MVMTEGASHRSKGPGSVTRSKGQAPVSHNADAASHRPKEPKGLEAATRGTGQALVPHKVYGRRARRVDKPGCRDIEGGTCIITLAPQSRQTLSPVLSLRRPAHAEMTTRNATLSDLADF